MAKYSFFLLLASSLLVLQSNILFAESRKYPAQVLKTPEAEHYVSPAEIKNGRYLNEVPRHQLSLWEKLSIVWKFGFENPEDNIPKDSINTAALSINSLQTLSNDKLHVIRLGHSTVLMKIFGQYWITDPMFSQRASPFKTLGPKRFHPPILDWADIINNIPLSGVIISHNHYDHLDEASIQALINVPTPIYVPLGLSSLIQSWGISPNRISEFNWWQTLQAGAIEITATPSQHFSGRTFSDENKTLWASWVIQHEHATVFFSGDGGYFSGFSKIGNYFDNIDISLMEAGAYNPQWFDMHLFPEQTVQAHKDLDAQWLIPVHNSTFDLSMHPWNEPLEMIKNIAEAEGIDALIPKLGQVISFSKLEKPTIDGKRLSLDNKETLQTSWW